MTDSVLPTRRQIREAERAREMALNAQPAAAEIAPAAAQPTVMPVVAVTPVAQPEPVLSRRELRERERASLLASSFSEPAPTIASTPVYKPEPAPQVATQVAPQPAQPVAPSPLPPVQSRQTIPGAQPWSLSDTGSIFNLSPVIGSEPQTASIVIQQPVDPLTVRTVTSTGEIIHTGSITIPVTGNNTQVSSATGDLSLIREASEADLAMAIDSNSAFVPGIPPVSSAGIIKSRSKEKAFPKKAHSGRAHMYLVLTSILLMASVAGLLIAAFMLGLFNNN